MIWLIFTFFMVFVGHQAIRGNPTGQVTEWIGDKLEPVSWARQPWYGKLSKVLVSKVHWAFYSGALIYPTGGLYLAIAIFQGLWIYAIKGRQHNGLIAEGKARFEGALKMSIRNSYSLLALFLGVSLALKLPYMLMVGLVPLSSVLIGFMMGFSAMLLHGRFRFVFYMELLEGFILAIGLFGYIRLIECLI